MAVTADNYIAAKRNVILFNLGIAEIYMADGLKSKRSVSERAANVKVVKVSNYSAAEEFG